MLRTILWCSCWCPTMLKVVHQYLKSVTNTNCLQHQSSILDVRRNFFYANPKHRFCRDGKGQNTVYRVQHDKLTKPRIFERFRDNFLVVLNFTRLLLSVYYEHREFLENLVGYKSIKVNIHRENHQNTEKVDDRSRVKLFRQRLSTYIFTKSVKQFESAFFFSFEQLPF